MILTVWKLVLAVGFLVSCCGGNAVQNQRIPEKSADLKRHRRDGDGITTSAPNPSGWLGRYTGPVQHQTPSGKSFTDINITGLTEVEIEKLKGNARNTSSLDGKGFPKRFNFTRGTLSPTHHLIHKATEWKLVTLSNEGNTIDKSETHASVKEKGKSDKKPNTDENKPELGEENQTSRWKVLYTEIGIGAACGVLLVSIAIVFLYWRRMKKRGKIEVAASQASIPSNVCSFKSKREEKSDQVDQV